MLDDFERPPWKAIWANVPSVWEFEHPEPPLIFRNVDLALSQGLEQGFGDLWELLDIRHDEPRAGLWGEQDLLYIIERPEMG